MIVKAILETTGVFLLACLCAWTGFKITHLKSKAWFVCFCVAFPIVLFVILLNRLPALVYQSVFSFLAEGRYEFMMMAISMPFVFGLLIPRLPIKRQRIAVGVLAFFGTIYFIIPPFLDPVILYAQMKGTENWIEDDVCIQTTNYTCGAASAVTALKVFGIDAIESELAIASYTSRAWGTSEHMLAKAIERMYGDHGIDCEITVFDNPADLQHRCPVIVIVKYRPLIDHYVTVLQADDKFVLIGDPLSGKKQFTHEQFAEKWRGIGIVIQKNN